MPAPNMFTSEFDAPKFSYDLRQRRAKLIADCIEDIVISMKNEDYYKTLKNIEDLYTVSKHSFSGNAKDIKMINDNYIQIKNDLSKLANEYFDAWTNPNSQDKENKGKIDFLLRKLFELVLQQIEDSGLFGTKYDDEDEL